MLMRLLSVSLAMAAATVAAATIQDPQAQVVNALRPLNRYTLVPAQLFDQLGWNLPDGGARVKALAEAAPSGAFDPRALEALAPEALGYRAAFQVLRYEHYGLEWDITGLLLSPAQPIEGLPTVVFINGAAANWYEFFVDPLNGPGVAQFLAQRVPVFLISVPGNYKPAGWTEALAARKPAYLLDRELPAAEVAARNAMFTFALVADGVAQLIERATSGPVVIAGHSPSGEVQFLLQHRLSSRMHGRSLGWGTGGPASIRREWTVPVSPKTPLTNVRARTPEEYAQRYVGPLTPLGPGTPLKIAERWFLRENRRRPQFQQPLQDLEYGGAVEARDTAAKTIRQAIAQAKLKIDPEPVIAELFASSRAAVTGYRRMIWVTSVGDVEHWDENPNDAQDVRVAEAFRSVNPNAEVRVLVFGVPMSHHGHIERPRQLAGGLLAALEWLYLGGI